jgi:hypothetical protein
MIEIEIETVIQSDPCTNIKILHHNLVSLSPIVGQREELGNEGDTTSLAFSRRFLSCVSYQS